MEELNQDAWVLGKGTDKKYVDPEIGGDNDDQVWWNTLRMMQPGCLKPVMGMIVMGHPMVVHWDVEHKLHVPARVYWNDIEVQDAQWEEDRNPDHWGNNDHRGGCQQGKRHPAVDCPNLKLNKCRIVGNKE